MLGPVCGMVRLCRSNLTTVVDVHGTVCRGATDRRRVPVFAAHLAVALKSASASSSIMVASGVTEPIKPEILMVERLLSVKANCGWKDTVIVVVPPGEELL